MNLSIRSAVPADAPAIQKIAQESWQATYAELLAEAVITDFLARNYSIERLERALNNPNALFFVAEVDGKIIGYCQAGPTEEQDRYELYRIYLLPAWWRKGIGGKMLEHTETFLRERGVPQYGCFVHTGNTNGKAFYEKRGFVHDPARDASGDYCEYYMVKTL